MSDIDHRRMSDEQDHETPESIRSMHARAESCIKTIGVLCIVGVVLNLRTVIPQLGGNPVALLELMIYVVAAIGGIYLVHLNPVGRTLFTAVAILFLVLACLSIPANVRVLRDTYDEVLYLWRLLLVIAPMAGPLAGLWILWRAEGRLVMSADYHNLIIAETFDPPHDQRAWHTLFVALLVASVVAVLALGFSTVPRLG